MVRSRTPIQNVEIFLDDGRMQVLIYFLMFFLASVLYITFQEDLSSSYLFGFGFVFSQNIRLGYQRHKASKMAQIQTD
ncbi:hypothetical protein [Sporosarcina sp. G11-34]|uniref:hypothetical protein n=1 Tax=Sporosarcina sp. G11-34 TaxID=2849605 RepID=UPI0022A981C7|nr:hypothetical protein [Sporosarcina sp. G11-34]